MILIIDTILLLCVIYMWYVLEKKWMTIYVGFDPTNKYWNYFLCDGVEDNVQIQAALDALPRWGGITSLEAKTYKIEDSINIFKNNVSLIGTEGYAHLSVQKNDSSAQSKTDVVTSSQLGFEVNEDERKTQS